MNNFDLQKQTLLYEFHAGSEQAIDELFRYFFPILCLFADKFLVDEQSSKDIAQEALLKVWQIRGDFESLAKLKSYLFVFVKNACLKEIEREKVKEKYRFFMADTDLDDGDMLKDMIYCEVIARLFNQVDTLPDQCRMIIKMTFQEGRSPKEIAQQLGITPSTVASQKMRGIMLLRKKLGREDFILLIGLLMQTRWY